MVATVNDVGRAGVADDGGWCGASLRDPHGLLLFERFDSLVTRLLIETRSEPLFDRPSPRLQLPPTCGGNGKTSTTCSNPRRAGAARRQSCSRRSRNCGAAPRRRSGDSRHLQARTWNRAGGASRVRRVTRRQLRRRLRRVARRIAARGEREASPSTAARARLHRSD